MSWNLYPARPTSVGHYKTRYANGVDSVFLWFWNGQDWCIDDQGLEPSPNQKRDWKEPTE